MDPLAIGLMIDGLYRIEEIIAESPRAHVYGVKHARFPDVPLVLKLSPIEHAADFERDTSALASLTTSALAHVCDRGVLPDGRPYRVVSRLEGPTLTKAMAESSFGDDRSTQIIVGIAAVAFEARGNRIGPLDLSIENLMFARGTNSQLCFLRVLVRDAKEPDPDADQAGLMALRKALDQGREKAMKTEWKPPVSIAEIGSASERAGGPHTPPSSAPGASIDGWRIVRSISETLAATVYDVISNDGVTGVLKIAGPLADRDRFVRDARTLENVNSPHVVRVFATGTHEDAPYFVMDLLEGLTLARRLATSGPFSVDDAIVIVGQMVAGAEAISRAGGGPADFALEHAYAVENPWAVQLTHATTTTEGRFAFYSGDRVDRTALDPWSAAVALYELLAGRLPFPITRHSLAKAWMGVPMPLGSRRRDVPPAISQLVNDLITGDVTMSRVALMAELARLRPKPGGDAIVHRPVAMPGPAVILPPLPPPAPPPPAATPFNPQPLPAEPGRAAVVIVGPGWPRSSSVQNPSGPEIKPGRANLPPPPPIDWRLELAPAMRCPINALTAVAMRSEEMIAANKDSLARWRHGRWTIERAPGLGLGVRKIVPIEKTDYLAISASHQLLRLRETGNFVPWGSLFNRYSFHGIVPVDGKDSAYLVGGSPDGGPAMIAKVDGDRVKIIASELSVRVLNDAVLMKDGSLFAVGRGNITRLRGGAVIETATPTELDLFCVGVSNEEVLVAGDGAYAFRVTAAPLGTQVEPVDTTSCLTCLAIDSQGGSWLGGTRGRILRRRDRHWRRMNGDVPGNPHVLAIQALPTQMRAVLADGSVILGRPVG